MEGRVGAFFFVQICISTEPSISRGRVGECESASLPVNRHTVLWLKYSSPEVLRNGIYPIFPKFPYSLTGKLWWCLVRANIP